MTEVRSDTGPSYTDPIAGLRRALRSRYEIQRQIGQGAYATVYLARDLKHERKVAIKVLTADPSSETGEIRFIREIRLVARLQHPNILPLHDSGHVEALLYYVMPYVDGETLRVRMNRERQMAVDAACAIARETADALSYAHKQGIVHRDIKPENILLSGGHAVVADFGIARAIDVAGVKQLTVTGVAGPGTPAYMSPEQLLGDRGVDARSDIYSLGCVLYEMLAGKPPFPGKDGFVKRFTEPPPRISSLRRDAPRWIDDIIATALAKNPADRFATATDFVGALCQPTPTARTRKSTPMKHALASPPLFDTDPLEAGELEAAFPNSYPPHSGEQLPTSPSLASLGVLRNWLRAVRAHPFKTAAAAVVFLVAGVALVAATGGKSFPAMFGAMHPIDSTRFVVLASTRHLPGQPAAASQIADSLYDAFTQWEGLPVTPDTRVQQAIADGENPPTTEATAVGLARRLGAGRTVWIHSTGTPEAPRVRIHLYDSRTGRSLDEFGVPLFRRDDQFYATAAQRLVGLRNRPPAAEGCDLGTRSFPAWLACSRGHIALARWDLAAAERAFRESVQADSGYATGRLWLAQILTWRSPEKRTEAYDLVQRSVESDDLTPRDGSAGAGLAAILEQRFQDACKAYAQLTKLDSLDFLGWYGLGECQAGDSAVVRSPASPSRWAFRSSAHSAVDAYMKALRMQPGAHEIFGSAKLQALMPVWGTITRTGTGPPPERERFAAFPTLEDGDTVGFVPYPIPEFARGVRTPAADAALRKNLSLLTEFAAGWAERFPRSPRSQEALADAFEARGDLTGPAGVRAIDSALALYRSSTDDTGNDVAITRLRARKVRVMFKRGELDATRILADSLLARPAPAGAESELAWVAALIGRADLAAHYWQRSIRLHTLTGARVPPMVAAPASRYFVYAALGICGAPLVTSRNQLEAALTNYVAADIRNNVRADLADRADFLAMPCTGGKSAIGTRASASKIRLAQQAFARGDRDGTRRILAAAAAQRLGWRPGDLSSDAVFQEAWVRLQIGDTATVEASLDAAMNALPTFGPGNFRDLAGAAAFGRAIALRAEVAAKRGDVATARRWATELGRLWATADHAVKQVPAALMLTLASPGSPR